MKNILVGGLALAFLSTLTPQLSTLHAQGTALTYQGRLNNGPNTATGSYDLTFAIYDALNGGTQQGNLLTNSAIAVSNGLFTATIDFGNQFPGANRWLEIGVRTNGNGSFATLSPRQSITAAPYSITAGNLMGTVSANGLSGSYSSAVTFANAANSFTGIGAGLTGLNASQLTAGAVPNGALSNAWKTTGNTGTTVGTQFIGTTDNQPLELRVNGARTLRLEPTIDTPNILANPMVNFVSAGMQGVTIAGGGSIATYGGLFPNSVSAFHGTISGGLGNTIQSNAVESTIAGGNQNSIQPNASRSVIGGGILNTLQAGAGNATIAGGDANTIQTNASDSTIGGGGGNFIHQNANYATVSGGLGNSAGGTGAMVGGGNANNASNLFAFVGGGQANIASGSFATIAGGISNTASGPGSFVGGGGYDGISVKGNVARSPANTIGGGSGNISEETYATVGGGLNNYASGSGATVSGGVGNTATFQDSTVGGGDENDAFGNRATVSGGHNNSAGFDYATVGGGLDNSANGESSTVAGGANNRAVGVRSFAAGQNALADHDRSFIWSSYPSQAPSFGPDTFFVSALNGIGINCGTQRADGGGQYWMNLGNIIGSDIIETSVGAHLTTSGVWANNSNRDRKTDFVRISSAEVLKKLAALSVQQWRYTNELSSVKHIGPTAQDFKSAFGLGTDDKSIGTVDEEGVALAAIQGLNQKVEAKDAEIQNLKRQNDSLAQRLTELESAVKSLAKTK
jgi:hypothetical protein